MAPEASPPYPLYDTTFTLHRVSPLYIKTDVPLTNSDLRPHAQNFRDVLAGDVLRGVRVGLSSEADALTRVGALRSVTWRILRSETGWDEDSGSEVDLDGQSRDIGTDRGIHMEILYEKALYTALLLRATEEKDEVDKRESEEGFQYLPLLMTRMPNSLRETLIEYLCTAFDVRISALKLENTYLTSAFEQYITDLQSSDLDDSDAGPDNQLLQKVLKEVQISIGFSLPTPSSSLKLIDIQIAREDLSRMLSRGAKIGGERPFMDALGMYVKAHMALDLGHEMVRIVKIACGAFVLGEGRVKLTGLSIDDNGAQAKATKLLMDGLVGVAKGKSLGP